MTNPYTILLALLLFLIPTSESARAQAAPLDFIDPATKQMVATNANQIMVEILTGVKTEGGKIYAGTKEALGQAYEAVKRETPEVVREFLVWRAIHHGVWMALFVALASIAIYWSRRFKKLAADCPPETRGTGYYADTVDDHGKSIFLVWRYVLVAVASLILLLGVTTNLYPMLKIYVAPRVYILEYVVDTVQTATQPHQQRR